MVNLMVADGQFNVICDTVLRPKLSCFCLFVLFWGCGGGGLLVANVQSVNIFVQTMVVMVFTQ